MSKEKIEGGIFQPIYSHQFRVDFSDDNETDYKMLSTMMLSVETKYITDNDIYGMFCEPEAKATIIIDLAPEVAAPLNKLYKNVFNMEILSMDGKLEPEELSPREILTNCKVSSANIMRSYTDTKTTTKVVIEINAEQYRIE